MRELNAEDESRLAKATDQLHGDPKLPSYVIFINGPPGSGKDTAADFLLKNIHNAQTIKASAPLKACIPAFFAIPDVEWAYWMEKGKDLPCPYFENIFGKPLTPREIQIWLSEKVMKPLFGDAIFGKIQARKIRRFSGYHIKEFPIVWICSDAGFKEEIQATIDLVGIANSMLIRLQRKDCTYAIDSRSEVTIPKVITYDVSNNRSLKELESKLNSIMKETWPDISFWD